MACAADSAPGCRVILSTLRGTLPLALVLAFGACKTSPPLPRYIATVAPLHLLGSGHPGICIAVDPADAHSAWWWEPGPAGCATRTTGPAVFRVAATLTAPAGSTDLEVRFQLQLMVGVRDVRLLLTNGQAREITSGAQAATERRADLEIPPAYGR